MKDNDLIKEYWYEKDGREFNSLLDFFKGDIKQQDFEKRVTRTNYHCLAVNSKTLNNLIRLISKGNFISFLDLKLYDNFSNAIINEKLIGKIKDFSLMEKYLDDYLIHADSWALIDGLEFNVTKANQASFLQLSKKYLKSEREFVKRCGIRILFKFVNNDYIDFVLDEINKTESDKQYYVNMGFAWLLCECFIKCREKTILFFENNTANDFIINNAIQKCRDSFRVTASDKQMLLNYKKKP